LTFCDPLLAISVIGLWCLAFWASAIDCRDYPLKQNANRTMRLFGGIVSRAVQRNSEFIWFKHPIRPQIIPRCLPFEDWNHGIIPIDRESSSALDNPIMPRLFRHI
jgi:hypothetical protein